MVAIDGVGFDWSYMAEDEVPTTWLLWLFQTLSYHVVPPSPTGLFSPPKIDLSYSILEEFKQPKFQSYGPKSCETESKHASKEILNELMESLDAPLVKDRVSDNKDCSVESPVVVEKKIVVRTDAKIEFVKAKQQKNPVGKPVKYAEMYRNNAPRAVLMKTGLRPFKTARPVNTAHPKSTVYSARPMSCFSKSAHPTVKRPYKKRTAFTNKSFRQTVNTARPRPVNSARPRPVNTVRPRPVNTIRPRPVTTARPNLAVANAVRGHPQQISKKLMKDMLPWGGANGSKITSKGTIHTGNFDFEDVYFVKKLPDENQILLRVPRRNNMYSVDIKNIVHKEGLTCLIAKATLDESMLCHRRLGHTNLKNINKLVKDNLLRGLPSKRFKNDLTFVACLKGKQHKASCIRREFSVARTPQQKSVAERRNMTLIEAARTMLADSKLPTTFWDKANATNDEPQSSCDAGNKDDDGVHKDNEIDAHEKSANSINDVNTVGPSINTASSDFVTCSLNVNTDSLTVYTASPEATHADFLGDKPEGDISNINTTYQAPSTPNTRLYKDHSLDLVIGDVQSGVLTRKMTKTTHE
nr:hypothetical protein [Tanacetum cinerariifolium]